jgi:flagellar biosynthesis/type III secretory pathway chaperone
MSLTTDAAAQASSTPGDLTAQPSLPDLPPPLPSSAPPTEALAAAAQLAVWLEAEFSALKTQDIDRFEQLQPGKTAQLQALTDWASANVPEKDEAGLAGTAPAGWNDFQDLIRQCRDAHWRNETLMSRQLDAIRGTLRALHSNDPASTVELYDRMGQMSRRMGARGFGDA